MYPLTIGSRSLARKLVVWFAVKVTNWSATEQSDPSTKKRWTDVSRSGSVLVSVNRAFCTRRVDRRGVERVDQHAAQLLAVAR
jgi:hypothetical protein